MSLRESECVVEDNENKNPSVAEQLESYAHGKPVPPKQHIEQTTSPDLPGPQPVDPMQYGPQPVTPQETWQQSAAPQQSWQQPSSSQETWQQPVAPQQTWQPTSSQPDWQQPAAPQQGWQQTRQPLNPYATQTNTAPQGDINATLNKGGGATPVIIAVVITVVLLAFLAVASCASLGYILLEEADSQDQPLDEWLDEDNDWDDEWDYLFGDDSDGDDIPMPSADPSVDDGELHSGWDRSVSYSYSEDTFELEETKQHEAYGMKVTGDFDISYPILKGDFEHLDEINAQIRDAAMGTYRDAYLEPTDEMKQMVETAVEIDKEYLNGGAYIASDVDWAITYNTDDFISVSFSDSYLAGSYAAPFIALRTVNIDLNTGKAYTLDDILTLNEDIAGSWADNLASYNTSMKGIADRDALIAAILGKGENSKRVSTNFFVDAYGHVNLNVNWWLSNNGNLSRGWWDVTLTDEQVKAAKKDSPVWKLIVEKDAAGDGIKLSPAAPHPSGPFGDPAV